MMRLPCRLNAGREDAAAGQGDPAETGQTGTMAQGRAADLLEVAGRVGEVAVVAGCSVAECLQNSWVRKATRIMTRNCPRRSSPASLKRGSTKWMLAGAAS